MMDIAVGTAMVGLGLALMPLYGTAQTTMVTSGVDTTRVTRSMGGLGMSFMVTPPPAAPGDTATVIVRMENHGPDSVRVMMYPCYRSFDGVRYYWVGHSIVCMEGSAERWLAAGAMYTIHDTLQFVDVPGEYELEYLAVAQPRVILRLPIVLSDTARFAEGGAGSVPASSTDRRTGRP